MKKPIYLHFTLEEYQQRLDALRLRMEHKGVDAMLLTTPENLYYLTGQQTPGYYWFQTLIVPMDREPVFITRRIEDDAVQQMSWVEDSRPYEDFTDWIAQTRDALVSLGLDGKRIGLENDSWFLTSRDYIRLTAMMTEARFEDCSGLVEQGRMIKSPQEIEYMRQAARAAEAGMKAGIEAAVVGATENEVAAEVHHAQILAGSEYTGLPIFVASGPRSAITHAPWYRLAAGGQREHGVRDTGLHQSVPRGHIQAGLPRRSPGGAGPRSGDGDRHPPRRQVPHQSRCQGEGRVRVGRQTGG